MSAKILPFKRKPKRQNLVDVGNDEIGVIEVSRYDDLTPNEIEYIKENLSNIPNVQETLAKLAQKIATSSGKKIREIYDAIVNANILEFADDNLNDLIDFQKVQREVAYKEKLVLASAILLHRIPSCADWTQDDVGNPDLVHPKLLRELAEFARQERDGWIEPEMPSEEELKKISPEPDSNIA